MHRKKISDNEQRKLYAESMGRCMNPNCKKELFGSDGDIMEKAHIIPYCKTADNSYENLIILCPSCHKQFDKLSAFSVEEVKQWKQIRKDELERFFSKKYSNFDDLKKTAVPLLLENKQIFENYFLHDNKLLWDKFEIKILINNEKLKKLFESNLDLFQKHSEKSYSNLEYIQLFIAHVNEFKTTRPDKEKIRQILFPKEINSMFGIEPACTSILPFTESLELLIKQLIEDSKFETVVLGVDNPYIQLNEEGQSNKIYLNDIPRLRQIYYNYHYFRKTQVRLDSLNSALKHINSNGLYFNFYNYDNLREINLYGTKIIFVYEYCLSNVNLLQLSPQKNSVIVNLHMWNDDSCISKQAYALSKDMSVTLLTMNDFYAYINRFKQNK